MSFLTKQEMLDTVRRHMHLQGKPSIDPTTLNCRYQNPDGCKCAVGVFMDNYNPKLDEGYGVGLRTVKGKSGPELGTLWMDVFKETMSRVNLEDNEIFLTLSFFQYAHDSFRTQDGDFVEYFEDCLGSWVEGKGQGRGLEFKPVGELV